MRHLAWIVTVTGLTIVIVFYIGIKEHTIRPLRKISSLMDTAVSENLHHLFISSQTKWSMRHPPPPLNHYFHFAFPHSPLDCPTNYHEILPISTSFFCRSYVCLHPNRFLLFLFTWKGSQCRCEVTTTVSKNTSRAEEGGLLWNSYISVRHWS